MSVYDENNHTIYKCKKCGKHYPDNEKHACETKVINIHSGAKYDTYIGRPGREMDGYYGNLHVIGYCKICQREHDREDAIETFRQEFISRINRDEDYRKSIELLRGRTLGCFCKEEGKEVACHGDIYVDYLNHPDKYLAKKEEESWLRKSLDDAKEAHQSLPDWAKNKEDIKNKKYRVAVVGSRNYNNRQEIYKYLESKLDKVLYFVSGGCKSGADKICEDFCKERGLDILTCYPKWKNNDNSTNRGAGFIRNKRIVENADIVVAFWTGSDGTKNTLEWAKKLNKKTIIHNVEPDKIDKVVKNNVPYS